MQFIIRLADGRTFARTVASSGSPSRVLLQGGYITGPAGAPLGLYRRTPAPGMPQTAPPPNLAADPIGTIATVTSVDRAYDLQYAGEENVDDSACYHVTLRPLRNPALYPLRDIWVNPANYQIVRLTYEQPFNASHAEIHYDFAPAGSAGFWTIVHIDASYGTQKVSEDLQQIEFAQNEPEEQFDPRSI